MLKMDTVDMDTADKALVLKRVLKLAGPWLTAGRGLWCLRPGGSSRWTPRTPPQFKITLNPAACSIKVTNPNGEYLHPNQRGIVRKYCSRYPLEPRIRITQQIEYQFMKSHKSITMNITFHGIRNDDAHGLVLSYVAQHLPEHVHVLRMANRLRVSWQDSHGDDLTGWIEFVGLIMQFQLRRYAYMGDTNILKFSLGVLDHVSPETFSERVNSVFAISMDLDQWATTSFNTSALSTSPQKLTKTLA